LDLPLKLLEGLLLLALVLGFAWWQLRGIRIDREAAAARQQAESEAVTTASNGASGADRSDARERADS
jgi:hypothetical protein